MGGLDRQQRSRSARQNCAKRLCQYDRRFEEKRKPRRYAVCVLASTLISPLFADYYSEPMPSAPHLSEFVPNLIIYQCRSNQQTQALKLRWRKFLRRIWAELLKSNGSLK